MKKVISYGLAPFLIIAGIGWCSLAIIFKWDLATTYTYMAVIRLIILLLVEFSFPLKSKWKMTWYSFARDSKYFVVGGLTGYGLKFLIGLFALKNATHKGLLSDLPIIVAAISALLIYEFLQYWFHRISHEAKGNFGQFLWKIHAIHHLPERVYLLMHSVVHPLNTIIVMLISQLVFVGLGVNAETLLIINTIVTLQGLLSHFNVEIKAGWLNYVFIGTELHRFHHSNKLEEAQNFGAVLSIWDIVFGSFYYKKNELPTELGVVDPEQYPGSKDIIQVLIFPFLKNK